MPTHWSHGNDPVVARIGVNASKGSSGKERYVTVHQCLARLEAELWFGMDMINWSTEDGFPCDIDVGDIILRWNNTVLLDFPVAALRKLIAEQQHIPPALVIRKQIDQIHFLHKERKEKRKVSALGSKAKEDKRARDQVANMTTAQIANQRDRHVVANISQWTTNCFPPWNNYKIFDEFIEFIINTNYFHQVAPSSNVQTYLFVCFVCLFVCFLMYCFVLFSIVFCFENVCLFVCLVCLFIYNIPFVSKTT